MSWDNEFANAEKQETSGGNYISSPMVALVEVAEVKLSEDKDPKYTGCPYLEVTFKIAKGEKNEGQQNTSKFFRVRDKDGEDTRGFKLDAIKKFFTNAGVDMKIAGAKALVEVVGKQLKVLFRSEEYVGYDKNNNNKPTIKTTIKYLYSGPAGEELQGQTKYFTKGLVGKDVAKFELESKKWEEDNNAQKPASMSTDGDKGSDDTIEPKSDNDDLPF